MTLTQTLLRAGAANNSPPTTPPIAKTIPVGSTISAARNMFQAMDIQAITAEARPVRAPPDRVRFTDGRKRSTSLQSNPFFASDSVADSKHSPVQASRKLPLFVTDAQQPSTTFAVTTSSVTTGSVSNAKNRFQERPPEPIKKILPAPKRLVASESFVLTPRLPTLEDQKISQAEGPLSGLETLVLDEDPNRRHTKFEFRRDVILQALRAGAKKNKGIAVKPTDEAALKMGRMMRKTIECKICCDEIEQKDLYELDHCPHVFHKECVQAQLTMSINTTTFPIECVLCKREMQVADWAALLDDAKLEVLWRRSLQHFQRLQPDIYLMCPTDGCPAVFDKRLYVGETGLPFYNCRICARKFCVRCDPKAPILFHEDMTCAKYQSWKLQNQQHQQAIKADEAWKQAEIASGNAKCCPQCTALLMKISGCNYVICASCRTPLCWKTGKTRATCGGGHGCH